MLTPQLYQEVTPAEIAKVISAVYGRDTKITACTLLKGGVFNTTYRVQTNRSRDGIVLRAAPTNRHVLFDFERSMMSAEPLFYQLLHDHGIPSSTVVAYDNGRQVIDREYIIFEYIPSLPMNDPQVPEVAKPGLHRQLGDIVARLHAIGHERFGWLRPHGELPMFPTWSAFLQRFATEIADRLAAHGLFAAGDLRQFLAVFAQQVIFDQITQPRLVHADLWEGNVLVQEHNGRWQVAALIDIDKAIFGDPALEFAFPTLLNDDFLRGYGRGADNSSDATFRRNAYRLLYSFMYTYIWHAQFDDEDKAQAAKQDGLAALARCRFLIADVP